MTLEKAALPARPALLERAMRANGIFSLVSGLTFFLGARRLASFLGIPTPAILAVLGAGLVVYAAVLLWVASRPPIDRRLAVMAILLDLGWVAGSALLVITPWVPFTPAGRWAVILIADLVAVFAVLQFVGLRRSPAGTHEG